MKHIKNITFIGAGNVASHLAKAFFNEDFEIEQVYSNNIENALALADDVNSIAIDNIINLNSNSDLYILSIKDDAIENTLQQIIDKNIFIVHTSGSIPISVFEQTGFNNYGIFYPLQTFSKLKEINLLEVPFCVEANKNESLLYDLANKLSNSVHFVNSEQRKKLHLSAVFACNFTNHMYAIAEDLCLKNNVNFNILKPLIRETAEKITLNHAKDVQTGPAIRGDEKIIENHINQLDDLINYQEIYRLITQSIVQSSVDGSQAKNKKP
ncbi:MAG: DUF2520 domain-containing protein [Flavobacteriales bacterium]|nr:DUF2520 domain-containing protein [Flavobacteriales bacterium]MCB9363312.1 DUF2520 domain-containing protein [Flavobacteriales bacterium]